MTDREPPISAETTGVLVDVLHQGVLGITLNRPDRLNAVNDAAIDDIHAALDAVDADRAHRVVLLRAVGRGFCSGFDMGDYNGDPESRGGAVALSARMDRLASIPLRMRSSRAVVVAAVRGPVVGGGFGLALGADILLAGKSAMFTLPQTQLGVLAAEMGISFLLPRIVGLNRAAQLMLCGSTIDADTALAYGLVTDVLADGEVDSAGLEFAVRLAQRSAEALASTKRLLMAGAESGSLTTTAQRETEAQVLSNYWPELRTSIARFQNPD